MATDTITPLIPYFGAAIKHAENDKYFGIRPKPKSVESAQKILDNSIYNNYARWVEAGQPGKFIDFMRDRWAPIGAKNDPTNLNKNWSPNVRDYLNKKHPILYKYLKSLDLVNIPSGGTYAA